MESRAGERVKDVKVCLVSALRDTFVFLFVYPIDDYFVSSVDSFLSFIASIFHRAHVNRGLFPHLTTLATLDLPESYARSLSRPSFRISPDANDMVCTPGAKGPRTNRDLVDGCGRVRVGVGVCRSFRVDAGTPDL